jgi:hypothetical protein
MFNGINLNTHSKTYDTPGNPNKGKDTNGTSTLPDPSPSSTVLHRLILRLDHFILRNLHLTLSYALLRALSTKIPLILFHVPQRNTTFLKIWLKNHVLCLSRSSTALTQST